LSRYWVTAAWAAVRTQGSYLRAQFLRLKARRGAKKAILAVAASMFGACYYMLRDAVPYRDLGALSLQPPRQAEDSRSPHPTLRTCPFVALPSEADPAMRFGVSSSTSSPSGLVGHRLARNAKPAFEQPTTISDATNRRRRESVRDGRSERGGDCGVRSDGRPGGRRNVPGASRRGHMSGPRAVLTQSPRDHDAVLFDLDGVLNIWNARPCVVK
jgi:hypothetical protein